MDTVQHPMKFTRATKVVVTIGVFTVLAPGLVFALVFSALNIIIFYSFLVDPAGFTNWEANTPHPVYTMIIALMSGCVSSLSALRVTKWARVKLHNQLLRKILQSPQFGYTSIWLYGNYFRGVSPNGDSDFGTVASVDSKRMSWRAFPHWTEKTVSLVYDR